MPQSSEQKPSQREESIQKRLIHANNMETPRAAITPVDVEVHLNRVEFTAKTSHDGLSGFGTISQLDREPLHSTLY